MNQQTASSNKPDLASSYTTVLSANNWTDHRAWNQIATVNNELLNTNENLQNLFIVTNCLLFTHTCQGALYFQGNEMSWLNNKEKTFP